MGSFFMPPFTFHAILFSVKRRVYSVEGGITAPFGLPRQPNERGALRLRRRSNDRSRDHAYFFAHPMPLMW